MNYSDAKTGRLFIGLATLACILIGLTPSAVGAHGDRRDHHSGLRAVPFVFVGERGDCGEVAPGTPYPAGSRIVTAAWLGGMGLPDNGGPNSNLLNPADNPNKKDPHAGFLMNKNGPTPDCASSGARILGVKGMSVGLTFTLGYDYRHGGHCGAGAPRFNVAYRLPSGADGFSFTGGCANDNEARPSNQDPQWFEVRHTNPEPDEYFPPIPPGSTIKSITLIYDEGTDTPSVSDPNGVGLAVVDNIFIDGKFIRRGSGIRPDDEDCDDFDHDGKRDHDDSDDDDDGDDDGTDEDDDNDGKHDRDDNDHDNDGYANDIDKSSTRETASDGSFDLAAGESTEFVVPADASGSVGAALDDAQFVVMEIHSPAGLLVGASLPAVGRVVVSAPAAVAGDYKVRVRNIGLLPVSASTTTISSRSW